MIKYFYIRNPNQAHNPSRLEVIDGKLLEVRDVYRGAPVACVAYQRRRDEDMSPEVVEGETPEQTRAKSWDLVCYAISSCRLNEEEFHKSVGRGLAENRLKVKLNTKDPMDQAYCFNIKSEASANEVLEMIVDEIAGHGFVPSHVRRNCQSWLRG
jgi:hypothetical protein